MPLEHPSEAYDPQVEGIYFPMRDVSTQKSVRWSGDLGVPRGFAQRC
jgi:hypothetical protein